MWKKYYVKYNLAVTSIVELTNQARNRRDGSYIWWTTESGKSKYGRVVVFFNVLDWEAVALVRPFKNVVLDYALGTPLVEDTGLSALELVPVTTIGGLVGRIQKVVNGRAKLYLVGDGADGWFSPEVIL
ncbi:hypothetical protein IFR05_016683 [Cadophora sp. M221]|nr:hypothetical protein IFR05_016683 [Cadophora sp. M221]